jgi:MFS family permease
VWLLALYVHAFLALRAQDAGMNIALIPLAFFAFNMISRLFSMPVGILSDRIGRRPVLIAGFLIFAAIYYGFGIAANVAWIWIACKRDSGIPLASIWSGNCVWDKQRYRHLVCSVISPRPG